MDEVSTVEKVFLDLTKHDYLLLVNNNKSEFANKQGQYISYQEWCKVMKCLKKLKSHYKRSNFECSQEPVLTD